MSCSGLVRPLLVEELAEVLALDVTAGGIPKVQCELALGRP
jgi:hypothetical protein